MFKKLTALILILCTIGTITLNALAGHSDTEIELVDSHHEVITDEETIARIAEERNLTIPEGYSSIEKIENTVYLMPEEANAEATETSPQAKAGIIYSIRNVHTDELDFYFPAIYEVDIYDGPASISETFTKSEEVKENISVTIGNGTVKAAVGYDITKKYTVTKTYSTSVGANQQLVLHIYVLYRRTWFDIYNKWTNEYVQLDAYTDKPVGVYITQTLYNK